MGRVSEIKDKDLWAINDHKKNTEWQLIKCYSAKQLAMIDKCDTRSIKGNKKYLPVRIDDYNTLFYYMKGQTKKPYSIKYIKVEEIEDLLSKNLWYKIVLPK